MYLLCDVCWVVYTCCVLCGVRCEVWCGVWRVMCGVYLLCDVWCVAQRLDWTQAHLQGDTSGEKKQKFLRLMGGAKIGLNPPLLGNVLNRQDLERLRLRLRALACDVTAQHLCCMAKPAHSE